MITGFVVQASGSFVQAFLLAAAIAVACALAASITIREPITIGDCANGSTVCVKDGSIPAAVDPAKGSNAT
jgi:hypothetical protein